MVKTSIVVRIYESCFGDCNYCYDSREERCHLQTCFDGNKGAISSGVRAYLYKAEWQSHQELNTYVRVLKWELQKEV